MIQEFMSKDEIKKAQNLLEKRAKFLGRSFNGIPLPVPPFRSDDQKLVDKYLKFYAKKVR